MSQAVALSAIRARVRRAADLGPDGTTGRYPNADVNVEINSSHRRLRELASRNGHKLYLSQSAPAAMTIGPLANTCFGTVPLPADCVAVYGIDVVFSATDVHHLEAMDWNQRDLFIDIYGNINGPPQGFHIYNTGIETAAAVSTGKIAIFPAPDRAYTYTIWYLPVWASRTTDTDVFDCLAGWDDFLVWNSVVPFLSGDNDMQQAYAIAQQERAKAEALIVQRSTSIQRVGPGGRRDVRAEQRMARTRGYFRFP